MKHLPFFATVSEKKSLSKSKNSSIKGFTLIEMVVTLFLLSMILSMCYAILFSTLEAKAKIEAMVESGKVAQGVLKLIARDIEACHVYQQSNPMSSENNGQRDSIEFTAWTKVGQTSTLRKIRYVLSSNADPSTPTVLFRGVGGGANFEYREIYDRILELNFEFWDGTTWREKWIGKGAPAAVRITIKLPSLRLSPRRLDAEKEAQPQTYTTIVSLPAGG